MQLFINNWATMLTSPAGASAASLSVPLADAAKLTGLGAGGHYLLTLAEVDDNGLETAWETVKITASAAGVLTALRGQEGTTARDWAAASIISARVTKGTLEALQSSSGTAVGDAVPQPLGAASAGEAAAASREDHMHPLPTAADLGAATAAQGAKADTAVQPAALASGLAGKVDVDGSKGLSDENYTAAEKAKLAGLEGAHFKGLHASLAALQAAHPSAAAGDYADVDSGTGADVARYIWDVSDSKWVIQSGASGSMTAAQIKTTYESNPDTNGFSDAEKAKLGAIAASATANATDAQLRDRSLHTGTQAASTISDLAAAVRGVIMTGVTFATATAGLATDSLLVFLGKLQAQINGLATDVAGKQATLVSATNIKTVNGVSLLGAGNLAVASLPVVQTFTGAKTLALTDINTYNVSQGATAQTVTLPAQATVAWTDDAEIHIEWGAAGAVTITGAAGVTINGVVAPSIVLFAKGAVATLKRKGLNNWTLAGAIGTGAEQRAAINAANKSGDLYSGTHEFFNSTLRFTGDLSAQVGDYGEITAAGAGGLAFNAVGTAPGGLTVLLFDGQTPTGTEEFSVRFFRNLNTTGSAKFVFFRANATAQAQHELDAKGLVSLNRFDGETVIGATTTNGVDKLQVTGSISATGAIKLASFTLATLPSAAANSRGHVYVSNLAGQAAPVYSDGTSWRRISDNTIAN